MNTRKMMVSTLAIALITGSSALAYAGQKAGCNAAERADKRLQQMTRQLNLDAAQQASVKALLADRAAQQPMSKRGQQAGLAGLDPNAADYQQQVQQQIARMQQHLAQRMQARADFKASLYAILTPEQEQKWTELRARHDHKKGHRGGHHQAHAGQW